MHVSLIPTGHSPNVVAANEPLYADSRFGTPEAAEFLRSWAWRSPDCSAHRRTDSRRASIGARQPDASGVPFALDSTACCIGGGSTRSKVPAARAQAFAAFLPPLLERIHELDPNHSVLCRNAEDVYPDWLKQGFASSLTPRPWQVCGAKLYSVTHLDQIIAAWPTQRIGGPPVISEVVPAKRGPDARASGYPQDWRAIHPRPGVVLGGLAYTSATNEPEDLDRLFGLVDANGNPGDAALSAVASAYLNDPSAAVSL